MVKYLSSYIFEIRNRDIVPCATENIAVVDDNDSRILKFKIPAVIDDVDITDKILAIRYVNALGQFDTFFSDTREVKTDGEKRYIIFPWYLSQKATAASGTLTYDISIYDGRITDAAEEGQYILHTKPQVLNIEKGLLDVGSASQNPDVWTDAIATFQKIIGSYSNDAMNAAEAAKKSEDNAKASEIKAESYKNAAAVSASNAAASEANANAYKDAAAASAESIRQSEINTYNYQIAAQNSAQAAATSEANAKQSEQNAATSETNAAESANKAKASQTASATSEANAKTSEQNAKASENASKTSADDSASSASDSANSAQASLNSQNAAKTSETKALASEKAAKQSEINAATSEQNVSNYADNSQQSADDAAASAAAALISQNASKTSEDKAKASETNAASSAAEAATSEAHAKTSETNAAKSETKAKASENAAAASASAAKTSETNAKTSETNAANTLAGALKLSGGTMTGDITMSGDAKFVGNLTGNADTATSADSATNDSAGQQIDSTYVKNVESTDDGKLIVTKGNGDTSTVVAFNVPKASTTTLGAVIVGNGLKISDEGVLSSDVTLPEVDKLTAYPVGSIFETVSFASPASMFGGIWEEIAQGITLMGATDTQIAGTTVKAGLPNITGSTGRFASSYSNYSSSDPHKKDGALSYSGTSSNMGYYSSSGSAGYGYYIDFDASKSNPIYGSSTTVRPPAYIVHIWERMGYLLNIYSTPGCTLTITNGETTVNDVVDDYGHYSRELPSTGTWTITVLKDGNVFTRTCIVNTYGIYTVEIGIEVFGVVWNYGNSSTALTRLTKQSDPYGFVTANITSEPVAAVGASHGTSQFDKYMPWKGMEEYNIANSTVGVKQGEQGFSRTNDTMVFIPEFYYKVVDDATNKKRYFYISSRWISGFEKHPGSGRYVGKYNTASGYVSKTGLAPLTNITRATARTKSMAKGSGWYQYDYASWCAVVLLYIVEYADWDSSSKIGTGAAKGVSGRTDSMIYHTGEASTTSGVQYRHIENVFGNIETFVDGINFNENDVYVCTNPDKYADDTYISYTNVGTKTGSSGYIKALGFSETAPWAIYPIDVGGSNTTYITDYCWNISSGWRAMATQGVDDAGILYLSIDKTSTTSNNTISSRLMFVPSKH